MNSLPILCGLVGSAAQVISTGAGVDASRQAVRASARHSYLLRDSSKLEQAKCLQFAPLSAIGTLMTDKGANC